MSHDTETGNPGRPRSARSTPACTGEAARIITDALLHDPGWLAVGPSATAHRRVVARVYHRAAIGVMDRHGGPVYGAFRDGRLVGVAATFAAGLYPPPARTFFSYVPGFLLAGPGADRSRPSRDRRSRTAGIPLSGTCSCGSWRWIPRTSAGASGGRCCSQVFEDAGAPVYLDTSNPANLPYYASFGFEEIGSGEPAARGPHVVHEASLRRWASGSPSSFFSVLFSIWRMRSRVTPNARPTSSSVRDLCPVRP